MTKQNKSAAEPGTTDKPAESTVPANQSPKVNLLSSEGIAHLLSSEFASEKMDEEPGENEVQPDSNPESQSHEGEAEPQNQEPNDPENPDGSQDPENPAEDSQAEETQSEEEETGEEEEPGKVTPEVQNLINKRIGKVVKQREEAKSALAEAQAKLNEALAKLEQAKASPAGNQAPADYGMDEKTLEKSEAAATQFVDEAQNFLDGTATEEEQARIDRFMKSERLDEAGLKRRIREYNAYLNRVVPAERQRLQEFRQQEAAAEPFVAKHFPWLDKKDSPEYAEAQKVVSLFPDLRKRTPNHRVAQGIWVLGYKAFQTLLAQEKAPAKATAPQKPATKAPPKSPATATAAPSKAPSANAREEAVREEFRRRPNRETATKLALRALQ